MLQQKVCAFSVRILELFWNKELKRTCGGNGTTAFVWRSCLSKIHGGNRKLSKSSTIFLMGNLLGLDRDRGLKRDTITKNYVKMNSLYLIRSKMLKNLTLENKNAPSKIISPHFGLRSISKIMIKTRKVH